MTQNSWQILVTKSNGDAMHYYIFKNFTQNRQNSRPGEIYPYEVGFSGLLFSQNIFLKYSKKRSCFYVWITPQFHKLFDAWKKTLLMKIFKWSKLSDFFCWKYQLFKCMTPLYDQRWRFQFNFIASSVAMVKSTTTKVLHSVNINLTKVFLP